MELGVPSSELWTYTFLFALFAMCIVFPPQEFNTAGFTIPKIFYALLGDERFNFVQYQIKRTCLTIFLHSGLPFGFCVLLEFLVQSQVFRLPPVTAIQYFSALTVLLWIGGASVAALLLYFDIEYHPVVKYLRRYNPNWKAVATEINTEVRVPLVYTIEYNAYSRVVVTTNWLIRVSNYTVTFAKISDSNFVVYSSNQHPYLSDENNGIQMIDVRIESISGAVPPFSIRVFSQEMLTTLRDQLARPIEVREDLTLPQPLHERFVDRLVLEIVSNPRYQYEKKEELEPCLGCSSVTSNVKLWKSCVEDESEEGCGVCRCRPMWCAKCIGRIFASKQDQQYPEQWMSGRAPCPTCRARFCVLDVCLLE